jgi:ribonuclease HI
VNSKLVHQLRFKLRGHCSNNQAEQIAILKVLEKLEDLQDGQDNYKHIAVYTDSKITLDLLQNKFKWNRLIECIRNKIIALAHLKWNMRFGWVKGHVGIEGNELVDRLAKEAAVEFGPVVYNKMLREVIITREKENGLHMWQWQWTNTGKEVVTKVFPPSARNRLQQKIPIFPEFTTMVTEHGKLGSYLHRFGLIDNLKCQYEEEEEETTNHLIFNCKILHNQRNKMIKQIKNTCGNWSTMNEMLANDNLQIFVKFVKSIDFQTCNDTLL